MEDKRVTAEELRAAMSGELDALFEQLAAAMNDARAGRIIADSEEPVRDAHGEFRQQAFQKSLELLQQKQESFSPSADGNAEQGDQSHDGADDQRSGDH